MGLTKKKINGETTPGFGPHFGPPTKMLITLAQIVPWKYASMGVCSFGAQ